MQWISHFRFKIIYRTMTTHKRFKSVDTREPFLKGSKQANVVIRFEFRSGHTRLKHSKFLQLKFMVWISVINITLRLVSNLRYVIKKIVKHVKTWLKRFKVDGSKSNTLKIMHNKYILIMRMFIILTSSSVLTLIHLLIKFWTLSICACGIPNKTCFVVLESHVDC